jgi:hypothetical protein
VVQSSRRARLHPFEVTSVPIDGTHVCPNATARDELHARFLGESQVLALNGTREHFAERLNLDRTSPRRPLSHVPNVIGQCGVEGPFHLLRGTGVCERLVQCEMVANDLSDFVAGAFVDVL